MVRVEVEVHTQRGSAPSAAEILISWVLTEINRHAVDDAIKESN